MMLIVGLGNPGKKYAHTRHNIGFRTVDEIAANFQFSISNLATVHTQQSIFNAQISKDEIERKKIVLAKPQTLMNNSGKSVKSLIKNLKLKIKNLIVVHDDIDIPLGEFKIQKGRGAAGHKGVQSIIDELKTKDFWRVRIGICPKRGKPKDVEKFVLQKFAKEEEKIIKETIKKAVSEITLKFGVRTSAETS